MKVLFERFSETRKQNVPVYKNFTVGRIRVGSEIFIIKIRERSPCDIQSKWDARCTRNKIKKKIEGLGRADFGKKI